jgi:hypothetical protein
MQFFPFRTIGAKRPFHITYDQINSAMKRASKRSKSAIEGRKYAVMDPRTGKTFSPKELLRLIIGDRSFYGGRGLSGANSVFRAFGFPVGNRVDLERQRRELVKRKGKVLPTEILLKRLFSQTWEQLPSEAELRRISDGGFPGVYLLAYTGESLLGSRVKEKDVFYVGMTCEGGLSKRLQQFRKGITHGGFHSAAERFKRVWLRGKPYRPHGKTRFYLAYLPVKCEKAKEWRSPDDIYRMSKVPELERAAIARVKSRLHHEPLLNKK